MSHNKIEIFLVCVLLFVKLNSIESSDWDFKIFLVFPVHKQKYFPFVYESLWLTGLRKKCITFGAKHKVEKLQFFHE